MLVKILGFFGIFIVGVVVGQTACPGTDWIPKGRYCYYVSSFTDNFQNAESACQSESAHVVSIHSEEENEDIFDLYTVDWPDARRCWLGLFKEPTTITDWEWTDGTDFDYERWAIGKPDVLYEQHCVALYTNYKGTYYHKFWDNLYCTESWPYMCQFDRSLPPVVNITIPSPRYNIVHNTTFRSSTGQDFTPECTQAYSLQINQNVQNTMAKVNQMIGDDICRGIIENQIQILHSSCSLVTNTSTGSTFPSYIVTTSPELELAEVHDCMSEISEQLARFENWPDGKVLEPEENCNEVIFDSSEFGNYDNKYLCLGSLNHKTGETMSFTEEAFLNFGKSHQGNFTSDVPLTNQCINLYNAQFAVKAFNMADKVNDLITTGALCTNQDAVYINTVSPLFLSVADDQGLTSQRYVFNSTSTNTYSQFTLCAGVVSNYLKLHRNWPDPILDPIEGCGTIVWTGDFQEVDEEWICREQAGR